MSRGATLSFRGLGKQFEGGTRVEVGTLDIRAASFTVLLGRSGCGKSTLLNIAAGLQQPTTGHLLYDGQVLTGDRPDSALIFQQNNLFPWMSAAQNIAIALLNRGLNREQANQRAEQLLAEVGLAEFAQHRPAALSGGMCQRIALARALALEPRLLLLDEPFSALDAQTRRLMQEQLLRAWSSSGATVLMVTHDLQEALLLADRIVLMASAPHGHVAQILEIDMPRPRQVRSGELLDLQDRLDAFLTHETRLAEHF